MKDITKTETCLVDRDKSWGFGFPYNDADHSGYGAELERGGSVGACCISNRASKWCVEWRHAWRVLSAWMGH